MEKRIKIIYWLTILVTIALLIMQGYWLFGQYKYALQKYEDELFKKTIDIGEIYREQRRKKQNDKFRIVTNSKISKVSADITEYTSPIKYIYETYIIDKSLPQSLSLNLDSLAVIDNRIRSYILTTESVNKIEHYYALGSFHINETNPFSIEYFDSLLQVNGIKAMELKIEITDSMVWDAKKVIYPSLLNPQMEVIYPFNILKKQQIRVSYQLKASQIFEKMLGSLICSLVLSLLLILCLIYQFKTIIRQLQIEELRKSFVKTMIHELKRPVTTLKLCVSFMKNDKMMQDKQTKIDILNSSHTELENLSSYFSKLRDLTIGDMKEIPLNISSFNLKHLIEECAERHNSHANKQVQFNISFNNDDLNISADRMHIFNIICNLVENAIKYSKENVIINIATSITNDAICNIEVSDNGIGISENECKHVFDNFFRSKNIIDSEIPGIGLGLSYVKLLVAAHGGSIQLKSKLNMGSTFLIKLPQKK